MNYRHAFHAGNFADVVKHIVVARIISYLRRKQTAFRVIDTHAGIGMYDLDADEAQRTGEADLGIRALMTAELSAPTALLLGPYLDPIRFINSKEPAVRRYPGSPVVARVLLRPQDKLTVNELHPADHALLAKRFARDRAVKTLAVDGYQALKSSLPPPERRGFILVDPPFEDPGEFDRLTKALIEGRRRFATGIFALWYPIKDPQATAAFHRHAAATGFENLLAVELMVQAPTRRDLLNGAGLLIANPPFVLAEELEQILPELARILGRGPGAVGRVFDCTV